MSKEELASSLSSMGFSTVEKCLENLDVSMDEKKLIELAKRIALVAKQFDSMNSALKAFAAELCDILKDLKYK